MTGRCILCAAILAFVSCSVSGQIIGRLDLVDQDTALGWACLAGDSTTKLEVELFARLNGEQIFLAEQVADKTRDDVALSERCGDDDQSRYHGFEFTVFPVELMRQLQSVDVIAVAVDGDQRVTLPGEQSISFPAAGLPKSQIWRTDYDDPERRVVALMSCVFPFKGANRIDKRADPSPLLLNAGATILMPDWESSPGIFSEANWCIENAPLDADVGWRQSNSATNGSSWPERDYWVVSANTEVAYSKVNPGPPSQSHPLNQTDGIYAVDASEQAFTLSISNDTAAGYQLNHTPFLSIGAQMGRGLVGPITWVEVDGPELWVSFDVEQLAQTPGDFHDIGVILTFHWAGYPRMIFVSLTNRHARQRVHWNWNAMQSFWFPGGEINYLGSQALQEECGIQSVPGLSDQTLGDSPALVQLPIRALLRCLETRTIGNDHYPQSQLGWTAPRPQTAVPLTGLHYFMEQGPNQPQAHMEVRFSQPGLFVKGKSFQSIEIGPIPVLLPSL